MLLLAKYSMRRSAMREESERAAIEARKRGVEGDAIRRIEGMGVDGSGWNGSGGRVC